MIYVVLNLQSKNVGDLILYGRLVSKSMKLNATIFTAMPIDLKDFDIQINELEQAQIDTFLGGEKETLIRNQKRKKLENSLKKLGLYVSQVSDGDPSIAHKAGMLVKSKPSKLTNILFKPLRFTAVSIQSGKAKLKWKPVEHARSYSVEFCDEPSFTKWQNAGISTSSRITISNLDKGKEYWFRIVALGINGMVSDCSDFACCVIK